MKTKFRLIGEGWGQLINETIEAEICGISFEDKHYTPNGDFEIELFDDKKPILKKRSKLSEAEKICILKILSENQANLSEREKLDIREKWEYERIESAIQKLEVNLCE